MKALRFPMSRPIELAFHERYVTEPNCGCWLWIGARNGHGYGILRGKFAHRISYEMHKGAIGDLKVLHQCDVPCCVNPDHLFLGTQADNVRDCHRKGRMFVQTKKHRMARGERVHGSKLTADTVAEIRARYAAGETQILLAAEYGVKQSTIQSIVTGKTWKHIPMPDQTTARVVWTRDAILAVHREQPNWRSYQIADRVGCDPGYVRDVLREEGITRRAGRPFKHEQWTRQSTEERSTT